MQSGTAIGLLVGGAVLLLAVSHRAPVLNAAGQPVQSPLNALNPFNWFGGGAANPNAIFPPAQQTLPQTYSQPQAAPGGFQNAAFSPYGSPNAYVSPAYTPPAGAAGAGMGTAANMAFPVMTPAGGFQSAAYQSPANTGAFQAAAATSPAMTPAQSYAA